MHIECLQQLIEHSSIEMTLRYARLSDKTREQEYFKAMAIIEGEQTRTHLKKNLSAPGGVAERFKMLTYYVYAPLFHRPAPCQEP